MEKTVNIAKNELAILKRIAKGDTNIEIATRLKLSVANTNLILSKIFNKTETKNKAHLVAWAYQNGLL